MIVKKIFVFLQTALLSLSLGIFAVACDNGNEGDYDGGDILSVDNICYVLNNGNSGGNDASIQHYDISTGIATLGDSQNNIFVLQNGSLLGDLAQNMLWIGDKLFVAVGGSQKLEILDTQGKRLREYYSYGEIGASPRMITTDGNNVYVTNYDGNVYVYDAATADYIRKIAVGVRPEGISYYDGYLVVNNSGTLWVYDGTVSIISLESGEVNSVQLVNPYTASVVCNGKVYIIDRGNYSDIPSEIYCVSPKEGTVTPMGLNASAIATYGNTLYYVNNEWNYDVNDFIASPLYALDVVTGEKREILSASKMTNVNSLSVNPATGDLYIGYSAAYGVLGFMRIYDADGVERGMFTAGYYPGGAYFKN